MLAGFTKRLVPLTKLVRTRNLTLSSVLLKKKVEIEKVHKNFDKFKCTQKRFQVDDGRPVYLKKGAIDKVFFQISIILTLVGVGMSLYNFYAMMMK